MANKQRAAAGRQFEAISQRRLNAHAQFLHGFAFRNTAIFRTVDQRAAPALFLFCQCIHMTFFQHAHIQFAQARIEDNVAPAGLGDNARRLLRATQIAGDNVRDT
ncbi:hypothetical protein D3C76_1255860 [compost metagenome]